MARISSLESHGKALEKECCYYYIIIIIIMIIIGSYSTQAVWPFATGAACGVVCPRVSVFLCVAFTGELCGNG